MSCIIQTTHYHPTFSIKIYSYSSMEVIIRWMPKVIINILGFLSFLNISLATPRVLSQSVRTTTRAQLIASMAFHVNLIFKVKIQKLKLDCSVTRHCKCIPPGTINHHTWVHRTHINILYICFKATQTF